MRADIRTLGFDIVSKNQIIMKTLSKLEDEVLNLQLKYDRSTGREAYKIGDKLRAKKSELEQFKIANEFSRILGIWLTPDQIFAINELNNSPAYIEKGLCATHEFCDPNEAMGEAFFNITNIKLEDVSVDELWDKYMSVWNAAWTLAKRNKFAQIS